MSSRRLISRAYTRSQAAGVAASYPLGSSLAWAGPHASPLLLRQILLQLRYHVFNLGSSRHLRYLAIVSNRKIVMFAKRLQHLKHLRVLIFSKQIDLKVQVISAISQDATPVLAHQYEKG